MKCRKSTRTTASERWREATECKSELTSVRESYTPSQDFARCAPSLTLCASFVDSPKATMISFGVQPCDSTARQASEGELEQSVKSGGVQVQEGSSSYVALGLSARHHRLNQTRRTSAETISASVSPISGQGGGEQKATWAHLLQLLHRLEGQREAHVCAHDGCDNLV